MENTTSSQLKQRKSWLDYTVKNLAFWVILALITGVIFGNTLYKMDENPKSIINSVSLVKKNINSNNLDNEYIFKINKKIEDRTITEIELKKLEVMAKNEPHIVYDSLLKLNDALKSRDNIAAQKRKLSKNEDKLTENEKALLAVFTEKDVKTKKEITDLKNTIKNNYLTPEEAVKLKNSLQNDAFTKDYNALNQTPNEAETALLKQNTDNTYNEAVQTHKKVQSIKSKAQLGINKFIALLKLLVGPIIFVTIILGIVGLESLKELGSIGLKAFLYFEIVSTFALAIGIVFGNFFGPGHGMNVDPTKLDSSKVQGYIEKAAEEGDKSPIMEILKSAIPHDPITPFLHGKTLQVLVMALCIAIFISIFIKNREKIIKPFEFVQHYLFKLLLVVMWLSPIATFCAMTFLIAEFGMQSLINMGGLLLVMLGACITFIFVILGAILAFFKINIFKFMRYIYKEVLIVFATSSSESALAPLMKKLENSGINKSVTGLVIPTGYSFNLDCTNIYLSLSVIFLAQAINVDLSIWHELSIILVLMVTSKGAVGVTGSGFIVLAATLAAMPSAGIPVVVVSILLGIDKFMSEMRAVGNLCGNSVACVVVALWDKQVDIKKFKYILDNPNSVKNIL